MARTGAGAVRGWKPSDRPAVRALVHAWLTHSYDCAGDLVPDDHNTEAFTDLGYTYTTAGEPTLLVTGPDGAIVGMTIWGPVATPLHMRARTCHAIATYVVPAFRRHQAATTLYRAAAAMARVQRYERVDSIALDEPGEKALRRAGFAREGVLVRRHLAALAA